MTEMFCVCSGDWKSKIHVWARLAPCEGLEGRICFPPSLQMTVFTLCLLIAFLLCPNFPFLEGLQSHWIRTHPLYYLFKNCYLQIHSEVTKDQDFNIGILKGHCSGVTHIFKLEIVNFPHSMLYTMGALGSKDWEKCAYLMYIFRYEYISHIEYIFLPRLPFWLESKPDI